MNSGGGTSIKKKTSYFGVHQGIRVLTQSHFQTIHRLIILTYIHVLKVISFVVSNQNIGNISIKYADTTTEHGYNLLVPTRWDYSPQLKRCSQETLDQPPIRVVLCLALQCEFHKVHKVNRSCSQLSIPMIHGLLCNFLSSVVPVFKIPSQPRGQQF